MRGRSAPPPSSDGVPGQGRQAGGWRLLRRPPGEERRHTVPLKVSPPADFHNIQCAGFYFYFNLTNVTLQMSPFPLFFLSMITLRLPTM